MKEIWGTESQSQLFYSTKVRNCVDLTLLCVNVSENVFKINTISTTLGHIHKRECELCIRRPFRGYHCSVVLFGNSWS